ncbi:MAG: type II secretion system F family protein [Candidatus Omnitrophota bacterium]
MHYLILILIFSSVFLLVKDIAESRQDTLSLHLSQGGGGATIERKDSGLRRILAITTPVSKKIIPHLKLEGVTKSLVSAGSPLSLAEFISFEMLAGLFAFVCATIIFPGKPLFICLSTVAGLLYPIFWLKAKIAARHREIRRDLPNVIDLLNLCVNAGLDFMLAVQRVIKESKPGPLREELAELWHEVQVGRSRREALRNLAQRVNLPEMTSFVRTLIQTDRMGAPMGEALRIQSEEIRVRRFQYGEAQAFRAPIKLLFPLLFFILPVVLVIIAGPIILQFMHGGLKF